MLTKKITWKRGDAIFLEPELLWSLLAEFWKMLINIKQLKSLMTASLTQKWRAVECLSNPCGYLGRKYNFWTRNTINLIKTIIESSYEHVDTYKISFLFSKPLKSCGSLYFTTFSMTPIYHTFASFGTIKARLSEPIFQSFHKDILISKISLPHLGPSKVTGCSIFNYC